MPSPTNRCRRAASNWRTRARRWPRRCSWAFRADIREAGLSAVVCTDASPAQAEQLRDELLDRAWATRADWVYHSDCNPRSPAPPASNRAPSCCWTIATTRPRAARWTTPRYWPRSCARDWTTWPSTPSMIPTPRNRPPGPAWARRSRSRWAARSRPPLRQPSLPLEVTGRVKLVFDGLYRSRPMGRGTLNDTGLTVVIDTGRVEIVVISGHQEPYDVNCLLSAGIDPTQKRYLALKSRMHWRAGYADMATAIIECAGNGVTTRTTARSSSSACAGRSIRWIRWAGGPGLTLPWPAALVPGAPEQVHELPRQCRQRAPCSVCACTLRWRIPDC